MTEPLASWESLEYCLLACELEEALHKCRAAGIDIECRAALPPRTSPGGRALVVRFDQVSKNKGIITYTYELKPKPREV